MKSFSSSRRSTLWKLIVSLAIAAWAISELVPFRDAPSFSHYIQHQVAPERAADLHGLLDNAAARVRAGQALSEFVGLKQIAHERKIDLSRCFPDIRLESSLHNVDRRTDLVMGDGGGEVVLDLQRDRHAAGEIEPALKPGLGPTQELTRAPRRKRSRRRSRSLANA